MLGNWTIETDLLGRWEMDTLGYCARFKLTRQHKRPFHKLQRALRRLGVTLNQVQIEDYSPPPELIDPVAVSTTGEAVLRPVLVHLAFPLVRGDHVLLLNVSFPPEHVARVRQLSHVTSVTPQQERHRTNYVRTTVYPKSLLMAFLYDMIRPGMSL